ncbi:MAG: NAD(P)/FAD-dependent oxidoreductase [Antricoccus sp.]
MSAATPRHRVAVIGSGFGGLFAARKLAKMNVDVTLISRTASHLFQPLLYQVATGILSEGEIAPATREILAKKKNIRPIVGEVSGIDLQQRTVTSRLLYKQTITEYDSLIVAAGSGQSYFGNDQFAEWAPGMKNIDNALEIRGKIFGSFEMAELTSDPVEQERFLTFVVVGAGPTGVEMAGQISELASRTLQHEFRNCDPSKAKVILLDGASQVLGSFGDQLSGKALQRLTKMQIIVQLNSMVTNVDRDGVEVKRQDGSRYRIESSCVIWAAGVQASRLTKTLSEQSGAGLDRAGRIRVNDDLTLPGHPEVFVVGDMIALDDLPGVAQVAIQGGRHAAETIKARLRGGSLNPPAPRPFKYNDKGSMATISRFSGVVSVGKLRFSGFIGWLMWLVLHLFYIVGFKSRITTLLRWFISFIGRGRSERSVTIQQVIARHAINRAGDQFDPFKPDQPSKSGQPDSGTNPPPTRG